MDEHTEQLADGPVPAPAPRQNRGWFKPRDRRINREGRPRGSKATAAPAESVPADCARSADRLKQFALPARELAWRLTRKDGFWLVNLPPDVEIVGSHVDAAAERVTFIIRSGTFPRVARGAPIPELVPTFHGLMWRRDGAWRPHEQAGGTAY